MQLLEGNSYELIKTIPDNSIDLIVTDPPYLIESTNAGSNSELSKSIQKMNDQLAEGILTDGITNDILEEFVRVMKKINIYIWCNHKQIIQYLDFFVKKYDCKFDILIWNKSNATPLFNNKYLTDKEYCLYFRRGGHCNPINYEAAKTVYYQPINATDKKYFEHPTIKPLNIIENLILNSSKENDIILDPFMGSGTTGVACKKHKRDFIGIELDQHFFEIAKNRINETIIQKDFSQSEFVFD
jgi:site-specific DNA-methyltransferase (adenine-specific)